MRFLKPDIKILRALAGEGRYNLYRLLANGQASHVFLKCVRTVLFHTLHSGPPNEAATVVIVKGANQFRLYRRQRDQLSEEFGDIQICAISRIAGGPVNTYLPRFAFRQAIGQIGLLLLMLVTSRKRYLDLFLLDFYSAIRSSILNGFPKIQTLICYNDQPFEVAGIIQAAHEHNNVRTIVIQHGLILNEAFYFPTNAQEFRAWGPLSYEHFRSRIPNGTCAIYGRYAEDAQRKSEHLVLPSNSCSSWRTLAAPSFAQSEIKQIVEALRSTPGDLTSRNPLIAIKLHPATKVAWIIRLWLRWKLPNIVLESGDMESLADRYDILITKNSTSAVDFLLLGKPVIFLKFDKVNTFPSLSYGFDILDISNLDLFFEKNTSKNISRKSFLKLALNV